MSNHEQSLDPKIIERIRKTLNLSRDGGATEHEAAAAAEMAQKLMRKYNLTLAEVEAGGGSGDPGSKRMKHQQKGRAQYAFQQSLMVACAEVNFCMVLKQVEWRRGREMTTGFLVIGREVNVIATRELYDYLNATTERLAFEYVGCDNRQRLSRSAISFKTGCAARLGERLGERHAEALEAQAREARERNAQARHPGATLGTALAIVLSDFSQDEEDRNTDFRHDLPEGTTAAARREYKAKGEVFRVASGAIRGSVGDRAEMLALASNAVAKMPNPGLSEEDVHEQIMYAVSARLNALQTAEELAKETPAQKAKREARERQDDERFWNRERRERKERAARTDFAALDAGARAGDEVGLDKQVTEGRAPAGRLR